MVRRTRTQRKWDLVQHCILGIAIILLGLAVALGPLVTDLATIPQNRVVGVLIMAGGALFVTARARNHRRYLTDLAERSNTTATS